MSRIITICARGGSKGVPGKNIKSLHGKPLIVHNIEQALACDGIEGVYVSTDDEGIAEVARQAGAQVPFLRPAELATDAAPKIPVIRHLVDHIKAMDVHVSMVVDLDPTSPLRITEDIQKAIDLLDENTDVVITGYESEKNPYFNMVEQKADGNFGLVKPPVDEVFSRQSAPRVFSMNGSIYVWWEKTLDLGLWGGRAKLYEMPRERSIDIDHPVDFRLVELLLAERMGR